MSNLRATLCLITAAALLSGCGFGFRKPERAQWRKDAEAACFRGKQVKEGAYVRRVGGLDGPGACGADLALKVAGVTAESAKVMAFAQEIARGQPLTTASVPGPRSQSSGFLGLNLFSRRSSADMVAFVSPEATLNCPMTAALESWIAEVIQPAALARFGQPVAEVRSMGSYACRPRNNQRGAATSEHGYANALDIGGFKLADGRNVTVLKGWKGDTAEQAFLRDVHAGACRFFSTVLGPGADMFHHDHFHVDLARHGRAGEKSVCRPYPQSGDQIMAQQQAYAQPQGPGGVIYNQPRALPPQAPPGGDEEMDLRELDLPDEPQQAPPPQPRPAQRKWFWQ